MLQLLASMLLGLTEWRGGRLLARLFWSSTGLMTESRIDDPVYKKNLQRLIDRNRAFEEAREARTAPRSRHD
jgi:hypothetical protein